MIKPEINDHLHLVYDFTIPLNMRPHLNTMIFRIFKHILHNARSVDSYENS